MKSRFLLATLCALACPLPAISAEWVQVRTPGEGDLYYYDRSKLFISGEEITYWKKVVFRTPQPASGQYAASGLYRERIHCAEHSLKLISHLLYAADGRSVEYVANHEGDAAPIIPDTLGDIFEQTACSLVRQRQDERQRRMENAPSETPKPHADPATKPPTQTQSPSADTVSKEKSLVDEKSPPQ